jgi:hypothetical protein
MNQMSPFGVVLNFVPSTTAVIFTSESVYSYMLFLRVLLSLDEFAINATFFGLLTTDTILGNLCHANRRIHH